MHAFDIIEDHYSIEIGSVFNTYDSNYKKTTIKKTCILCMNNIKFRIIEAWHKYTILGSAYLRHLFYILVWQRRWRQGAHDRCDATTTKHICVIIYKCMHYCVNPYYIHKLMDAANILNITFLYLGLKQKRARAE